MKKVLTIIILSFLVLVPVLYDCNISIKQKPFHFYEDGNDVISVSLNDEGELAFFSIGPLDREKIADTINISENDGIVIYEMHGSYAAVSLNEAGISEIQNQNRIIEVDPEKPFAVILESSDVIFLDEEGNTIKYSSLFRLS